MLFRSDLDAAAAPHRFRLGPEMHVGRDQVGAPGDDQVAVLDRFRVRTGGRPDRQVPGLLAAGVADRAGNQAGFIGSRDARTGRAITQVVAPKPVI